MDDFMVSDFGGGGGIQTDTGGGGGFDLNAILGKLGGGMESAGSGAMNFLGDNMGSILQGGGSFFAQLLKSLLSGQSAGGGQQPGGPQAPQMPMTGMFPGMQTPQGQAVPQQNPLAMQAMRANLQSKGIYSGGAVDPSTLAGLDMSQQTQLKQPGQSYSPFFSQQLQGLMG